jgi:hypothetical protein
LLPPDFPFVCPTLPQHKMDKHKQKPMAGRFMIPRWSLV